MTMTEEKKLPDFIELLDNGNLKVTTKEGVFVIEEPTGETFDNVERIAQNIPQLTDFMKTLMLLSKSMKPSIPEGELKAKYKISTLMRLVNAFKLYVDEEQSFLLITEPESKSPTGKVSSAESDSDLTKPQTN